MDFLTAYDAWCFRRVEAILLWLEEWLSIPQKMVERGLIAVYVVLILFYPERSFDASILLSGVMGLRVFCAAVMGHVMWTMHRRPAAIRAYLKGSRELTVWRFRIQIIFLSLAAYYLFAEGDPWINRALSLAQIVYLFFSYVVDIHSGGERGRRRKLALMELKKLFGTEWMPRPAPVPQ